jgi:hypothetical protein
MATPAVPANAVDQLLVVGGELTADFVGQVEVPEHLATHPDRDPRNDVIGGWPSGNPTAAG